MPSAIVGPPPASTGSPRSSDAGYAEQASACTPITRTPGRAALSTPATPPISPPPPTGTTTAARSSTSSSSSSPSVPWPATISGSSNGCTKTAPVSAARARARSTQPSTESPPSRTVPPKPRTAATLASDASAGMKTSHASPRARAA